MLKLKAPKLPKLPQPRIFDAAFGYGETIINELRLAAQTRAEDHKYDLNLLRSFSQLAASGGTLFLLYRKAKAALPFSVAAAAVVAGLSVASRLTTMPNEDERSLRDKLTAIGLDCLPTASSAIMVNASPAIRDQLTNVLDLMPRDPSIPFTAFERGRNLVSLYATYTLVGHWAEMLFCQLIRLGIMGGEYDRSNKMLWDWWLHPFPAEGIAGVLIAGGLHPLHEFLLKRFNGKILPALALSYLATQAVCTSIDYLTGMVANRNYELWDYRDMPFNFQGQICLQNSTVYSVAATFITWIAYPARMNWLRKIPADIANTVFAAGLPCYLYMSLMYFV